MLCLQYVQNCTFINHSVKNITFSLKPFIRIRGNNLFDISFPLWFDWKTQVSSKMFYGSNVSWFFFWKLKYFPCIALLSLTQIVILLQMTLLGLNCLRLNVLYWATWEKFGLENWNGPFDHHIAISFESNLLTPHQVWPRSIIPRGFKVLFQIIC